MACAVGWIAAILIVFRLVWGFIGGEHSRFSDFIRPSRIAHHISGLLRGEREPSLGHNPLGAVAVVILLVLTAATVWTGAFGGEAAEELHEVTAWVLLAMSVNGILDTNYGYFNGKPDGTVLDYLGPWPWYVLAEVVIVAGVWALITVPWVRRTPI